MVPLCELVLREARSPPYSRVMGTEYSGDDRVSITEVGGAEDQSAVQHQRRGGSPRLGQEVNPFFFAAWSLALTLLVLGMMWLFFSIRGTDVSQIPPGISAPPEVEIVETSPWPTLMNTLANLTDAGPFLLTAGCLLSGLLLIVHGMNYRTKMTETGTN